MWITKMKTANIRNTEFVRFVRIPFIFRPFINVLGFVRMAKEW